jgi:hypothetical protein
LLFTSPAVNRVQGFDISPTVRKPIRAHSQDLHFADLALGIIAIDLDSKLVLWHVVEAVEYRVLAAEWAQKVA